MRVRLLKQLSSFQKLSTVQCQYCNVWQSIYGLNLKSEADRVHPMFMYSVLNVNRSSEKICSRAPEVAHTRAYLSRGRARGREDQELAELARVRLLNT